VQDANSHYLALMLREQGVDLQRIWVVPDEFEDIAETVLQAKDRYDWIFTSGGVGPTHDDITIEAVARALGKPLVVVPEIARLLEPYKHEPGHDARMRMAMAPEGYHLCAGRDLTFPVICVDNFFILPGVPEIFRKKIDAIRDVFVGERVSLTNLYLRELWETDIAATLSEAVAAFAGIRIGSYPVMNQDDFTVRVTIESRDPDLVKRTVEFLLARIAPEKIFKVG
ncbi:MAG: competence/damage-inducible protein A, partial [Candidatus Methylomirabilis sp.]|nr:competence/damage-inducible protein A [Deltaproteobacteria bacterium]